MQRQGCLQIVNYLGSRVSRALSEHLLCIVESSNQLLLTTQSGLPQNTSKHFWVKPGEQVRGRPPKTRKASSSKPGGDAFRRLWSRSNDCASRHARSSGGKGRGSWSVAITPPQLHSSDARSLRVMPRTSLLAGGVLVSYRENALAPTPPWCAR